MGRRGEERAGVVPHSWFCSDGSSRSCPLSSLSGPGSLLFSPTISSISLPCCRCCTLSGVRTASSPYFRHFSCFLVHRRFCYWFSSIVTQLLCLTFHMVLGRKTAVCSQSVIWRPQKIMKSYYMKLIGFRIQSDSYFRCPLIKDLFLTQQEACWYYLTKFLRSQLLCWASKSSLKKSCSKFM